MTKYLNFYVSGFLFAKGIKKGEKFRTSAEEFGTLVFDGENVIEDGGDKLSPEDITHILENTKLYKLA